MIRAFLRKLKRFVLRHAGIVALTESQATARAEVSTVASSLQEVKDALTEVRAALTAMTAHNSEGQTALRELKASLAEAHSTVRETKASLGEVWAALARGRSTLNDVKAGLAETKGNFAELTELASEQSGRTQQVLTHLQNLSEAVRPHLAEHSELLRQLNGQAAFLGATQHRANEEQGLNRLAIDNRLAAVYSQLVHIEAFYQILSQLGVAYNRLNTAALPDLGIDKWKIQECEGLLRYFRKKEYLDAVATARVTIPRVETDHPTAAESNDTRFPRGAKNDNSICLRFNRKLYALFGNKPQLKVLDLGCAGGGLVRSLLDDGHFATGLEGSPYPKINQAGEWATIPYHLHTCDVTKPFTIRDTATGEPIQFDAITAWELMEHIPEESVPGLMANIDRHLAPGGRLLCSIATFLDKDDTLGVVWHVTVKSREWWVARYAEAGFEVEEQDVLDKNDWLRGSGNCRGDWHEDDNLGFHLVLRRRAQAARLAA